MVSAESFRTTSLRAHPRGAAITRILAAAIQAVEPGEAVRRSVIREGDRLVVAGQTYDLSSFRNVILLGLGKASVPMAGALAQILGPQLSAGLVVTKHLPESTLDRGPQTTVDESASIVQGQWSVLQGGHPLPDERSLEAGQKVLQLLSGLGPQDLLLCLISGGGSALLSAPVEGISLSELQALTRSLLACGASIDEINSIRRKLDRLKGGGIVEKAHGATVLSLILSDVVGNRFESIASGPTVPDPTSLADVLAVIKKYGLREALPAGIRSTLERPLDSSRLDVSIWDHVQNIIIGSNVMAAQAGLRQASLEGFNPYLLRADQQGEARQAAFELATLLRQAKKTNTPAPRPACIIAGGETTVMVHGKGRGGRNTELALAAVTELAGFPEVMLITLASDGEDGPTDAAGAVVTGETFARAAGLGLNQADFLERNDSYSYFDPLGDLLKPGPTGTNVNDLIFLFTF